MRTSYHKRENMDDMLTAVKDIPTATAFLATLSEAGETHPSISFTMEAANSQQTTFHRNGTHI